MKRDETRIASSRLIQQPFREKEMLTNAEEETASANLAQAIPIMAQSLDGRKISEI